MSEVRGKIVLAAMRLIAEGRSVADFESFGIQESDWQLIRSEQVWLFNERSTVQRIFQTLVYGVMDCVGVSHFKVSAEYMAAVIVMFVHPTNIHNACAFFEQTVSNEDLSNGREVVQEVVSSAQLAALCLEVLNEDGVDAYRKRLEKRTRPALVIGKDK